MPKQQIKNKTFTFGTCSYGKVYPHSTKLTEDTKTLNIFLSFEDTLKLNLAVDEAARKLNSYNRATTGGKSAALQLTIHLDTRRITINEGKL